MIVEFSQNLLELIVDVFYEVNPMDLSSQELKTFPYENAAMLVFSDVYLTVPTLNRKAADDDADCLARDLMFVIAHCFEVPEADLDRVVIDQMVKLIFEGAVDIEKILRADIADRPISFTPTTRILNKDLN